MWMLDNRKLHLLDIETELQHADPRRLGAAQHISGESIEQLHERADTAVHAARHGGRNQVRTPEPVAACDVGKAG
jgi:hypothetical protein